LARKGWILSEAEIRKIIALLSTTDMTILEIAQRMGCSRSAIASANRKFRVREYAGKRTRWGVTVQDAPPSNDGATSRTSQMGTQNRNV
jgi:hypothetical protein